MNDLASARRNLVVNLHGLVFGGVAAGLDLLKLDHREDIVYSRSQLIDFTAALGDEKSYADIPLPSGLRVPNRAISKRHHAIANAKSRQSRAVYTFEQCPVSDVGLSLARSSAACGRPLGVNWRRAVWLDLRHIA